MKKTTLNGVEYELVKYPFNVLKIITRIDGINDGDYVIDSIEQFETKVIEIDQLFN